MNEQMSIYINELLPIAAIFAIASLLVMVAIIVDLVSGLQKAKARDERTSSYGLKRTLKKFILYEGGLAIAFGMDVMIHLSNIVRLIGVDLIYDVPVVSIIVTIGLLVVEGISVRESADEKLKDEFSNAVNLIIDKDEIAKIIAEALKKGMGGGDSDR